jgi:catechol 2,3-dioxygenase-like lactoylglutathione lyase family enzyme
MMPAVTGLLESSLYVADLRCSVGFYRDLFGFEVLTDDERLCALSVAGRQVLLLFKKGLSAAPSVLPGGTIPGHDGGGRPHLAFAVAAADLPAWEERLRQQGVAVESTVDWSRGGRSVYFRDPDGHLVELATPGVWSIY